MLVGLAVVPLVVVPTASDIFGLTKFLVAVLATTVGWAAWSVLPAMRRGGLSFGLVERAVVAYLVVATVSALLSRYRSDSLLGSYERYGGVLSLVVFIAFAALLVLVFRGRPDRLALVPLTLAGTAAVVAVYVLLQTAGIDVVDWKEASGASARYHAGTLGNGDFAGGFLGIALPFAVAAAMRLGGRARLTLTAATVVIAAGIVATRSRGGVLAAVVGLVVLALLDKRLPRRLRLGVVVGALTVAAVGGALLALPESARPDVLDRTELFRTKSFEVRAREWAGAWEVFASAPVLGTGPDTFEFGFPEVRSRQDGAELGMQIADKPHNVVLEKASDTGLLGLAAYVAVLVAAFVVARRRPDRTAVFAAGLAAYVAQGLVSIDVPPLAMLGWVAIGGIVAASAPDEAKARPLGAVTVSTGRTAGTAVVVVAVVALVATAQAADLAAADGRWDAAVERNPAQPFYRYGAAFAAERAGAEASDPVVRHNAFTIATRRYDEVLDMQPGNVLAMVGRARSETTAARLGEPRRFPEADRWWARAGEADPHNWEIHNNHGLLLNAWSNAARGDRAIRTRAAERLEAALRIKPGHVPALVNLARIRHALGDFAGAREAAARALTLEPGNAEARALAEG